MTKLKAHFDGKVLVPDEPVELPVDCDLEIHVSVMEGSNPPSQQTQSGQGALGKLLQALDQTTPNPDWPVDGAEQHDHYLYGLPKRQ